MSSSDDPSSSDGYTAHTSTTNGDRQLPLTPQKTQHSYTPITPTANLKVLVAAAAAKCAIDRENQDTKTKVGVLCDGDGVEGEGCGPEDGNGRKTKSLSVLCKKFLSIADSDQIGVGSEFSLESMAHSLGTNRRRIYDIINVLESLEMIVKQSKNWYKWLGQDCLLVTLAKLKAMAHDDIEFRQLYDAESSKENILPLSMLSSDVSVEGVWCEESGVGGPSSRWDKSLGVLCQKFVMLFLITPNNEVTLDCAGSILMPESSTESSQGQGTTNPKTKVRRLYDIANVLTTLGLIRKKTFLAPNHRKMPGYSWCGPSQEEIDTIPVSRKSEFPLTAVYSNKPSAALSGTSLSRRASFGKNRPFLHQYEITGIGQAAPTQPSSAPASPVKVKEAGFKRSLSFGGGINPKRARSEGVKLVKLEHTPNTHKGGTSLLTEIREFEAEMMRHAHKYPQAPMFREFVQRYTATLEATLGAGRTLLPKPTTPLPTANKATPLSIDHRFINNASPLVTTKPTLDSPLIPDLSIQALIEQGSKLPLLVSQAGPSTMKEGSVDVENLCANVALSQNLLVGDLLNKVKVATDEMSPGGAFDLECSEVLPTDGYSKRPAPAEQSGSKPVPVANITAIPSGTNAGVKQPSNIAIASQKQASTIPVQALNTASANIAPQPMGTASSLKPGTNVVFQAMNTAASNLKQPFNIAIQPATNAVHQPANPGPRPAANVLQPTGTSSTVSASLKPTISPDQLRSTLLNSLVSQKPIPSTTETTKPQLAPINKPLTETLPLSALLAGQIVTCLQPNAKPVDGAQLVPQLQIPVSLLPQLSALLSLPAQSTIGSVSPAVLTPPSKPVVMKEGASPLTSKLNKMTVSIGQGIGQGSAGANCTPLGVIQQGQGVVNRTPLGVVQQGQGVANRTPLGVVNKQNRVVCQGMKQVRVFDSDKENQGIKRAKVEYSLTDWQGTQPTF